MRARALPALEGFGLRNRSNSLTEAALKRRAPGPAAPPESVSECISGINNSTIIRDVIFVLQVRYILKTQAGRPDTITRIAPSLCRCNRFREKEFWCVVTESCRRTYAKRGRPHMPRVGAPTCQACTHSSHWLTPCSACSRHRPCRSCRRQLGCSSPTTVAQCRRGPS